MGGPAVSMVGPPASVEVILSNLTRGIQSHTGRSIFPADVPRPTHIPPTLSGNEGRPVALVLVACEDQGLPWHSD